LHVTRLALQFCEWTLRLKVWKIEVRQAYAIHLYVLQEEYGHGGMDWSLSPWLIEVL